MHFRRTVYCRQIRDKKFHVVSYEKYRMHRTCRVIVRTEKASLEVEARTYGC